MGATVTLTISPPGINKVFLILIQVRQVSCLIHLPDKAFYLPPGKWTTLIAVPCTIYITLESRLMTDRQPTISKLHHYQGKMSDYSYTCGVTWKRYNTRLDPQIFEPDMTSDTYTYSVIVD